MTMDRKVGETDAAGCPGKTAGIRQAWSVARYNFRQWHKNPRVLIAFSLGFILCFLLSDKTVKVAETYGLTMQLLEPFIWAFGDSDSILLVSLLLVFLFADMPFLSSGTPFYLMRVGRRVWLGGQVIYVMVSTFLYLVFILVSTAVVCMKYAFSGNLWSKTAVLLGYSSMGKRIFVPVTIKTMEMTTPYACAMTIFGLILLYSLLLVLIMLVFNLYRGQLAGMLSVFGFSLFGLLLSPHVFQTIWDLQEEELYIANVVVGWLSPLNQAAYPMHNFGYDLLPSLGQTGAMFLALILLCVLAAMRLIRNYNFTFTGTEGGV